MLLLQLLCNTAIIQQRIVFPHACGDCCRYHKYRILSPEVLRVSPFPHNFIHAVMVRVLGGMNMCCFTRFTRCSSTSGDDFLLRLQIANKGLVLR